MGLAETNFNFKEQSSFYRGKVRDVYFFDKKMAVVASDRISAFDHVLPKAIPYKGQVLNLIAAHFLNASQELVPNWLDQVPHPNVSIGKVCEPIRIEMVVRGYLAGHAWRLYKAGTRSICGVTMPEGMKESGRFPEPIITPATKAAEGHDEDISAEEILSQGIVSEALWNQLCEYALTLFDLGTTMAKDQGLILVDTKYEFGLLDGELTLIDEIHTPDSSRYYYHHGYEERQLKGEKQKQLSKEFVREWLMENGFQGKEGQKMPFMPEDFVSKVTERYIQLYELITGTTFEKKPLENGYSDIEQAIANNV